MKTCRALLFSFAVLTNTVFANTFTTDFTDMWWNANESGWGVTATHQREIIFLTFFVYGTNNQPTFYTATTSYNSTSSQGSLVFSGDVYQTTGPWLGTFFNTNAVGVRKVGTATFTAFIDAATLVYSVDGTTVTKALTRQTFRNNDLTGDYAVILRSTASGCANLLNAGTSESIVGVRIAMTSTTFSMISNDGTAICTYTGNYSQTGRMGRSQGSYSCPGVSGTYDLFEIEANPSGFTGRASGSNNLCSQFIGHFGAAKR